MMATSANPKTLPSGWRWVKLGGVCEHPTETRDLGKTPDAEFRYVDISSVDNRLKRITSATPLMGADAPSRARQVIRTGDVLVATTRPNLNAIAVVPAELDGQICSTGFCVLRPTAAVETDWLFAHVRTSDFVTALSGLVKGALYPGVSDKQVFEQPLPLPPLPEQRRIAGILNGQMQEVEKARKATETQLEAARALPAAYLREVFDSREAKKWPRRRLGDVATVIQNGVYRPAEFYGHGATMLRMYNVISGSCFLNLSRLAYVDLESKEVEAYELRAGDLLFSRVNSFELVGKCAVVDARASGFVFENMLIRVRLGSAADPLFVAQQMSTPSARQQVEAVAKRAIGQSSINSDDIRGLRLALPEVETQRSLATAHAECRALADQAVERIEGQLEVSDKLPAALLRKAFNGEV